MRLNRKLLTQFKTFTPWLWLSILSTLIIVVILAILSYNSRGATADPIVILTPTTSPPSPTPTAQAAAAAMTPVVDTNDTALHSATPEVATPAPSSNIFYLSLAKDSVQPIGSVEEVRDEDILRYGGVTFTIVFDGSAAGLANSVDVDAFHFVDAETFLISFDKPTSIGPLKVDDSDIVKFEATSLGLNNTSGTFSLFLDGSEVGLRTRGENIDAIALLPNGSLLISTEGIVKVPGIDGNLRLENEDILAFVPAEPDNYGNGLWSLYLDGSDTHINGGSENIDGLALGPNDELYLTTTARFSVDNIAGSGEDVFIATPTSLENSPAYSFSSSFFFEGSLHGLQGNNIDAISIP